MNNISEKKSCEMDIFVQARISRLMIFFGNHQYHHSYNTVASMIYNTFCITSEFIFSVPIFKCVSLKDKIWFKFESHRWRRSSEHALKNEIETTFITDLESLVLHYTCGYYDNIESKIKNVNNLISRLKTNDFMLELLYNCQFMFYDSEFEQRLDDDDELLCFENGIYDFRNMIFRHGLPTDYVSLSVGYKYKEYEKYDEKFVEINNYLKLIHPDDDVRNYLLKNIAGYLVNNRRKDKTIIALSGNSYNRKATISIMRFVLGDYFGNILFDNLCSNKHDSYPELVDKQGKRLLVTNIDQDNQKCYQRLKALTDNVYISKRYDIVSTYMPQFRLFVTTNISPQIDDIEFKNTIRLIECGSTSENALERPIDRELIKRFIKWRGRLMWMLITEFYPKYIENTDAIPHLEAPTKILEMNKQDDKNAIIIQAISKLRDDMNNLQQMMKSL